MPGSRLPIELIHYILHHFKGLTHPSAMVVQQHPRFIVNHMLSCGMSKFECREKLKEKLDGLKARSLKSRAERNELYVKRQGVEQRQRKLEQRQRKLEQSHTELTKIHVELTKIHVELTKIHVELTEFHVLIMNINDVLKKLDLAQSKIRRQISKTY